MTERGSRRVVGAIDVLLMVGWVILATVVMLWAFSLIGDSDSPCRAGETASECDGRRNAEGAGWVVTGLVMLAWLAAIAIGLRTIWTKRGVRR